MSIATINPTTGETLATFEALTDDQIEQKIRAAVAAFEVNRRRSFAERARLMTRTAEILTRDAAHYGRTITLEMGKPIKSALAEVQKCALVCRYYAENGERHLADEPVSTEAEASYVRFQPIGPVLAVMPWNFPFWQVFRFAAPALMAGNVALLKHASNVPGCALAIEEILSRNGLPFHSVLVPGSKVEPLIADQRIAAVTLTGSSDVGVAARRRRCRSTVGRRSPAGSAMRTASAPQRIKLGSPFAPG